MTGLLEKAIEVARKSSPEMQDCVGQAMIELVEDEAKWGRSFADPRSEKLFAKQASAMRDQIKAGKATDLNSKDVD